VLECRKITWNSYWDSKYSEFWEIGNAHVALLSQFSTCSFYMMHYFSSLFRLVYDHWELTFCWRSWPISYSGTLLILCSVGLPPVPDFPGCPGFVPCCPASRQDQPRDAKCPGFRGKVKMTKIIIIITIVIIDLVQYTLRYSLSYLLERYNQSGFYWSKRQWLAVESHGPYASLHLTPDR